MTNTQKHAQRELDILTKTVPDAIVREFIPEILALCESFGESGQTGATAPLTARALAQTIEKLCLHKTIAPLTGEESEWGTVADELRQNNRASAVFRDSVGAYYLDAITWQGEDKYDAFSGTVEGIRSRQRVREFPFTPKTFRIDVYRIPYIEGVHKVSDSVSCGSGDYVYFIKDREQLKEVFEYYDLYSDNLKS